MYDAVANEMMAERGVQLVKGDTTMWYRYAAETGNGTLMGWR
jgi:hypothetical protein